MRARLLYLSLILVAVWASAFGGIVGTTTDITITESAGAFCPSSVYVDSSGNHYPDASCTGVPAGTTLTTWASSCNLSTPGAIYDSKRFNCDVDVSASNITIKNSLINGGVFTGDNGPGQQTGLVIQDTEINCGCWSQGQFDTPTGLQSSNVTLIRVNLHHSGHGVAPKDNFVMMDSYIHDLGGNTEAHKDAVFAGDGTNVRITRNTIECNDGPTAGCTSAVGLLSDFGVITNWVIDGNLLNTIGAYCFYGGGGPGKPFVPNHITFTNNRFGNKWYPNCAFYGYVTYFDVNASGNVWSGNVRQDNGATVPAAF